MRRGEQYLILLLSAVAFLVLSIQPARATDELYLTGVVRTVIGISNTVVVDVKSASCLGIRSFSVDHISALTGTEGKTISFSINSSRCKSGEIYKMHLVRVWKGGKGKR